MSNFDRLPWKRRILSVAGHLPNLGPRLLMNVMRRRLNPDAVTIDKVRNFILANQESEAKALKVQSLPYILNLDTVNACNLACPFCVTGTKQLARKQTRIPLATAKAVIDKVKSHVLLARFHNWGEPFLNKEIFDIIRYAGDAGIHTTVSSNLSIRTENLAESQEINPGRAGRNEESALMR